LPDLDDQASSFRQERGRVVRDSARGGGLLLTSECGGGKGFPSASSMTNKKKRGGANATIEEGKKGIPVSSWKKLMSHPRRKRTLRIAMEGERSLVWGPKRGKKKNHHNPKGQKRGRSGFRWRLVPAANIAKGKTSIKKVGLPSCLKRDEKGGNGGDTRRCKHEGKGEKGVDVV